MNNDGMQNEQELFGGFDYAAMYGLGQTQEMVWRCDAMRAGKLYNRVMFDTRDEAEDYARNMRNAEPDQMFQVDSVAASSVWN